MITVQKKFVCSTTHPADPAESDITVFATFDPGEPRSYDHPGIPPHFDIEYVEGMSDEEVAEFLDHLEDVCWERATELMHPINLREEKG